MNEDENLRLHYLELLGISVWQQIDVVPLINPEAGNLDVTLQNVQGKQSQLAATEQQFIWGEGDLHADWFVVIDWSTRQENNSEGALLESNEGLLINEILRALKLSRDTVFMTYLVKCPPFSAAPLSAELIQCYEYLQQQILLIKPKILLVLGEFAAQTLLKTPTSLIQLRGKVFDYNNIPVVVSFSPAHLLSDCLMKRAVWNDLQLALKTLQKKE